MSVSTVDDSLIPTIVEPICCDSKLVSILFTPENVDDAFPKLNKNSSGDEIANVNFLRRYGTYVLKNTKKKRTYFV